MDAKQAMALAEAMNGSPLDESAVMFEAGVRTRLEFPDAEAAAEFVRQMPGLSSLQSSSSTYEYGLPLDLLQAVVNLVGKNRFDGEALQREFDLTRSLDERQVGTWGSWRLVTDLLSDDGSAPSLNALDPADFGLKPAQLRQDVREVSDRLSFIQASRIGYAGWLCTLAAFVQEHDELLRKHHDRFLIDGFPVPVQSTDFVTPSRYVRPFPVLPIAKQTGYGDLVLPQDEWLADYGAFCTRWRLSHLTGPLLPEPLSAQIPLHFDATSGTGMFVIPDIYPIGGRGFLGEAIEDALRGRNRAGREHLQEWLGIVSATNTAKNRIARFARLLRLQHYWRVLHQRQAEALQQQRTRLVLAFTEHFDCSEDTIKDDLQMIESRLGADWAGRPDPLAGDGG